MATLDVGAYKELYHDYASTLAAGAVAQAFVVEGAGHGGPGAARRA